MNLRTTLTTAVLLATGIAAWAQSPPAPPAALPSTPPPTVQLVQTKAAEQVAPLLDSIRQLVGIESGSRDLEGLGQTAKVIADRLTASGMSVQVIPTKAPDFHPQLKGAPLGPMVYATRTGRGQRKVLLIAHMDTVYQKGMVAQQPFRIDGDKAWGLGISDDKGGVALVLHTVDLLAQLGFDDYAQLGVLINGDEEIGSPGSASFITQKGAEYDAVLSFEGGGFDQDMVRLATSSIAIVEMKITGRASHAGANPGAGRNAVYEMAHQMLKSRNFGDPAKGLQINWTVANGGDTRNVIPASATAVADVRSLTNQDLDLIEAQLKESIKEKLIPDTQIELTFYRSRPAFVANDVSRLLAAHAQGVFKDMGLPMVIRDRATGGGTDAAFAGLRPRGGVLESFGPRGFGAHSNSSEYIFISSLAPRLTLATKMVMDVGSGALRW